MDDFNLNQPIEIPTAEESIPEDTPQKAVKTCRLRTVIISSVCCLLAGAILALMIVPNALRSPVSKQTADKLTLIQSYIDAYYIDADKVDDQTLSDAAAWGYVGGLGDIYSTYYDAQSYTDALYSNSGGSHGIGITAVYYEGIYIVRVTPNSPAQNVGLKKGDVITAVEGEKVTEENYAEMINAIRGEKGTEVRLEITRPGEISEAVITRDDYTVESVYSRMVGGVGIITITGFTKASTQQFEDALEWVQSEGATALVFDLRNNGGGLVDDANKMLDMLLPEGEIGYAMYKGGKKQVLGKSDKNCVDLPMAVIVNGQTASSAEYFASALRDSADALLIGENTFGKGIMQSTFPLGDGSAIKLTVAKIYTESGYEFHKKGLKPDVKASYTEEQQKTWFLLTDSEDPYVLATLEALKDKTKG